MAGPRAQGGSATDRVLLEHGPGVPLVRVPSVLAWSCVGCRAQLSAEGNGGGGGHWTSRLPRLGGPLLSWNSAQLHSIVRGLLFHVKFSN